jgi:hypothetical protein
LQREMMPFHCLPCYERAPHTKEKALTHGAKGHTRIAHAKYREWKLLKKNKK